MTNEQRDPQLINTVHGALRVYDLPDLAALLGKCLTINKEPK